jgi:hypothetical protein
MKTLIVNGPREFNSRLFQHGDELPPGFLTPEQVGREVDQRRIVEYDASERRSLYRLFPAFSGCAEREQLTDELSAYAIPA